MAYADFPPDAVNVSSADVANAAEVLGIEGNTVQQSVTDDAGNEYMLYTQTGYIGLDISIDFSMQTENGRYSVPVELSEPINLLDAENAEIISSNLQLYHIVDGTPVTVEEVTFDVRDGILYGFTFTTDSFSPYMVSYTVDFVYNEKRAEITIDLEKLQEKRENQNVGKFLP